MIAWLRRYHLFATVVWVVLVVPAMLWWRDSVVFVVIMSLYANIAASAAAYQGTRVETQNNEAGPDMSKNPGGTSP